MIYIGIDIAKSIHYACIVSDTGEPDSKPFSFENNSAGFNLLISKLPKRPKADFLFGLESTAHYGNTLCSFLFNNGFNVGIINPIQTAALRKSNIRNTKNDAIDSKLIVKALVLNDYHLYNQFNAICSSLKSLCLFRYDYISKRTRLKIQLTSYLDQVFPELANFFKAGLHTNSCYSLLKSYPSALLIKNAHLTALSNLLSSFSRGHYSKITAVSLKQLAAQSVGLSNHILELQIVDTISKIQDFNASILKIDSMIKNYVKSLNSPIMTIHGMGYFDAAVILGFIGDISRFNKPAQILAFAGLDPIVRQSGQFSASSTRMSKRGNFLLRYALINASHNVVLHNKTFKDYYDLKVSQGKRHYNALGHVAFKLVRVIFYLITRNKVFNLA